MDNLEKVEKLREKADISYDEARRILEECGWDLLEAVVKLEAEGRLSGAASSYQTKGDPEGDGPRDPVQVAETYDNYQKEKNKKEKGALRSLWEGIKYICRKGCENSFFAKKDGAVVIDIPVILLAILMICFFWILLIVMAIGLFFGFSYGFSGPELGRDSVNSAMDKASQMAENIKAEVKEEGKDHKN